MGSSTKIDWADASWNPVTGCYRGCSYCYARHIAVRFGAHVKEWQWEDVHELDAPWETTFYDDDKVTVLQKTKCPYPFDFEPTLHRYRMDIPKKWKKPKNIFVCSMADLFGKWVKEKWIWEVITACKEAPQHRYLFLTKNPNRYVELIQKNILPTEDNFWYGSTTTRADDPCFWCRKKPGTEKVCHSFLSIEPIMERFGEGSDIGSIALTDWVIVGAETGNRKDRVIPKKEWIMDIADECKKHGKPIFMKESLKRMMRKDFRQEFPW